MKRRFLIFTLLVAVYLADGQQADTTQLTSLQKQELLSKAKTQKAVGWIMFGTGAPVTLGSLISIIALSSGDFEQGKAFGVLAASTAYTLVGYSFIRKGNRNKRQALSLHFNAHSGQPFLAGARYRLQSGLSLKLHF